MTAAAPAPLPGPPPAYQAIRARASAVFRLGISVPRADDHAAPAKRLTYLHAHAIADVVDSEKPHTKGLKVMGITTKMKALAFLCADALVLKQDNLPFSVDVLEVAGKRVTNFMSSAKSRVQSQSWSRDSPSRRAITEEEMTELEHQYMSTVIYEERSALDFLSDTPAEALDTSIVAAWAAAEAAVAAAVPAGVTLAVASPALPPYQPNIPGSAESAPMDADGTVTRHAAHPVADSERAEFKRVIADSKLVAEEATKAMVSAQMTKETRSR